MSLLLDPPTITGAPPEQSAPATPSEVSSRRLVGVDIARGIALLGMMTVHVSIAGPDFSQPGETANWFLTAPSGRASVLFFMLSGLSLSYISMAGSRSAEPATLRRRGLVLLIGGLVLSAGAWSASILEHYGVMFLLAPWFLRRQNRTLVGLATLGMAGGPIALMFTNPASEAIAGIPEGAGAWAIQTLWSLAVTGTYPLAVWFGFFALGIRLGRLNLRSARTACALVAIGVFGVLGVWGTTSAIDGKNPAQSDGFDEPANIATDEDPTLTYFDDDGTEITEEQWLNIPGGKAVPTGKIGKDGEFDFDDFSDFQAEERSWRDLTTTTPHSGQIGWAFQSSFIALAVLGLMLLAPKFVQRLLHPLAALGSISLTAYLLHTVLVTDVWQLLTRTTSFDAEPTTSISNQIWILAGLEVLLVLTSVIVVRFWKTGPFERLLKQLSRPTDDRFLTR